MQLCDILLEHFDVMPHGNVTRLACLTAGVQSAYSGPQGRDGGGDQVSRSDQGGDTGLQEQVKYAITHGKHDSRAQ